LKCTFLRENVKNRAFYGGEYSYDGAVYFGCIYHNATQQILVLCLRGSELVDISWPMSSTYAAEILLKPSPFEEGPGFTFC
jgi:hypothetical protein